MGCPFISQLSRLKKSSSESVDNTNSFDLYKKYLHVERKVETELRTLLHEVNSKQDKCLILLCGSAGDGKSHLISYLRNSDSENLLDGYELYNDATESSKPTLTAIDTLSVKLSPFNDNNYKINDHKKMIVAINLGTLNNFIESEKSDNYSEFKTFVETNDIISGISNKSGYLNNSNFQYVNFSDYQIFSLTETGIETTFLKNLISKVFGEKEENPFYKAYLEDVECPLYTRCPVRHNFEFLSILLHQQTLIHRIVEIVIADKAIVSTREVLNLLYDLIVPPNFDKEMIKPEKDGVSFLSNYISSTTPMLLNELGDISNVLNALNKHDPLKGRDEFSDDMATRFHAIENIKNIFSDATNDTPYKELINLENIELGGINAELKKLIYRFIVRLRCLTGMDEQKQENLNKYVQYMYYQCSGNAKNLGELYKKTQKAVMRWNGQFDNEEYICIDDTNDQAWILENLTLKPCINRNTPPSSGTIDRFPLTLRIAFKKDDNSEPVSLDIDFALFNLILDICHGYCPTTQDKNRHADFASFVQQLIEFGDKSSKVTIIPKYGDRRLKVVFEETAFGYSFKVVQ